MTKKVEIVFPECDITVIASVLEKEEPESSELLWKYLEKPVRCAIYNTLSTGCLFISKARPPKEPVVIGTQANPVGRNLKMLCDMIPGEIMFTGMDFWCCYGPETEPLLGGGSVAIVVDPEYLDKYLEAGRYIWHCQQIKHTLVTMTVSRKEN